MVVDKAHRTYMPNQLIVMFGIIQLKTKSFHETRKETGDFSRERNCALPPLRVKLFLRENGWPYETRGETEKGLNHVRIVQGYPKT